MGRLATRPGPAPNRRRRDGVNILRRMGTSPEQRGSVSGANCPDVFLLDSGAYLVIGRIAGSVDRLGHALAQHGASVGVDEIAVVVPADCMRSAAADIIAGREESTT